MIWTYSVSTTCPVLFQYCRTLCIMEVTEWTGWSLISVTHSFLYDFTAGRAHPSPQEELSGHKDTHGLLCLTDALARYPYVTAKGLHWCLMRRHGLHVTSVVVRLGWFGKWAQVAVWFTSTGGSYVRRWWLRLEWPPYVWFSDTLSVKSRLWPAVCRLRECRSRETCDNDWCHRCGRCWLE